MINNCDANRIDLKRDRQQSRFMNMSESDSKRV